MRVDDNESVVVTRNSRVFHQMRRGSIGVPFSSDPDWFHPEDYASAACRPKLRGQITTRGILQESGFRPCARCYRN